LAARSSVRETLKTFAPELAPSNTLKWEEVFEKENGSGVRIALLDSGVNWSDPVFAKARIWGRDFTGSGNLFDPTCHGSANAALLVGQSPAGFVGLSPDCELLVAKVLGHREWKRTVKAITAALRWAIHAGSDVVILPFGTFRGAASIIREIRSAVARECRVFAAAGNRGADMICFPAWLPEVTAVSALTYDGCIYPGCCALDNVDIYCLGDHVPTVGCGETTELSGSSPATVLAAGISALQRAAQRRQSQLGMQKREEMHDERE
jgi:membrane-anchored mycosin MYCP